MLCVNVCVIFVSVLDTTLHLSVHTHISYIHAYIYVGAPAESHRQLMGTLGEREEGKFTKLFYLLLPPDLH